MLIGIVLLVCGCLLYVLIKPPTMIHKDENILKNEKRIGVSLSYMTYKGLRHLVLPKGMRRAKARVSRNAHDSEVKPNA